MRHDRLHAVTDHLWETPHYFCLHACEGSCGEDTRRCLSDRAERDTGRWSDLGWCETPDPSQSSTEAVWRSDTKRHEEPIRALMLWFASFYNAWKFFNVIIIKIKNNKKKFSQNDDLTTARLSSHLTVGYLWSHDISLLSDVHFDHSGFTFEHLTLTFSWRWFFVGWSESSNVFSVPSDDVVCEPSPCPEDPCTTTWTSTAGISSFALIVSVSESLCEIKHLQRYLKKNFNNFYIKGGFYRFKQKTRYFLGFIFIIYKETLYHRLNNLLSNNQFIFFLFQSVSPTWWHSTLSW